MSSNGPLPAWTNVVTVPLSILYGSIVDATLDMRARRAARLPRPTISIGNISSGGTGKSPVVRDIARRLVALGSHPLIVTRGYRARAGEVGDETIEHRAALPGVPVVEGVNRALAVRKFFDEGGVADCIILDDGFQRRDIVRDLDIVVVPDIDRDDQRLPRGFLREMPSALDRAHLILRPLDGQSPVQWESRVPSDCFSKVWTDLRVYDGGRERTEPTSFLQGKKVALWAGIGRVSPFRAMVEDAGAKIVSAPCLRDHVRYTSRWLTAQCESLQIADVQCVVATEKDWGKISRCSFASSLSFVRPQLTLDWSQSSGELDCALRLFSTAIGDVLRNSGGSFESA